MFSSYFWSKQTIADCNFIFFSVYAHLCACVCAVVVDQSCASVRNNCALIIIEIAHNRAQKSSQSYTQSFSQSASQSFSKTNEAYSKLIFSHIANDKQEFRTKAFNCKCFLYNRIANQICVLIEVNFIDWIGLRWRLLQILINNQVNWHLFMFIYTLIWGYLESWLTIFCIPESVFYHEFDRFVLIKFWSINWSH